MDQNMHPSYSFSMLDMVTLDDAISYTFMCRNKRFIVEGELVDQLYEFKDDIDDPDIISDFGTWVIDAVDEHIKRLAPAASQTPTTLLEYYGAETDTSPKIIIVDSETRDAESTDGKAIIHRSIIPTVPFIPASQLARAAGPESMEEEMCEVPRNVQRVDTDQEYFFKAAYDGHGFQREVEVLAKIQNLAEDGLSLATSRIAALVYWDGQETVLMGMLLERIDGPTLADARGDASAVDGGKWMDQIGETVKKLHEHGLFWGDVKPENVMIGPSGDAILIDFGGGCTPEYIDLELQETMEGDLQGIKRMREMLREL